MSLIVYSVGDQMRILANAKRSMNTMMGIHYYIWDHWDPVFGLKEFLKSFCILPLKPSDIIKSRRSQVGELKPGSAIGSSSPYSRVPEGGTYTYQ
jgi:hypothetical protein